jgi:3-dehydroquinate dehydratase type I
LTIPRICVSIPAFSTDWVVEKNVEISKYNPDIIEIRFDYQESEIDLELLRKKINTPLIATNRRADQGGLNKFPEDKRVSLLLKAIQLRYDYIDIAITTPKLNEIANNVHENGVKLIVSYHDFVSTPDSEIFEKIFANALKSGADICKIIGTAKTFQDNLTYFDFLKKHPRNVSFAMGKYGTISRVLSPLIGGDFTYASIESGQELAPGQISIKDLRKIYRILGARK